jgi:hypothetical protein
MDNFIILKCLFLYLVANLWGCIIQSLYNLVNVFNNFFWLKTFFKVFKIMIMFYHIDSNVHSYLAKQLKYNLNL